MLKFLLAKNLRGKGFTLSEILCVLSIIAILAAIATFNYSGYRNKASDTAAQEDLRQAYSSAINYFLDQPAGILTMADLQKYGFTASPNVKVMIINGRLSDLLLISSYNTPGAQIYLASRQGMSQPGASGLSSGGPGQGSGGVPGTSGGPQDNPSSGNLPQRQNLTGNQDLVRLCNQAALMDLQGAYRTAQLYLGSNPGGEVTKDLLLAQGYIPNENVSLVINDGGVSNLTMSAIFNFPGTADYRMDRSGISSTTR